MDKSADPVRQADQRVGTMSQEAEIVTALAILERSERAAAAAHLQRHGVSFRTMVRVLSEPLQRRTHTRSQEASNLDNS
jgi:hypothetical protein